MKSNNTFGKWPFVMAVVSIIIAALLPFPFWQKSSSVTTLGRIHYLFLFVCSVLLFFSLLMAKSSMQWRKAGFILAVLPLLSLGVKWIVVPLNWRWFELFHNSMGLGMEILGFLPNMVIDGGLFAAFLGTFFAGWRCGAIRYPMRDGN